MQEDTLKHYDISLLYVEDERITREQISRILQRIVTELYIAEDGNQGLEIYKEKRPDIIMTDIMMPILNGLEMSREIRAIDRDSQIIMLTAYSDTEYLLECISLGINQYVQKPVDFSQLTSAIESCSDYILLKRKLQQQEARIKMLSQAVEQAPALIMITTQSGAIQYINNMFSRMTGYLPSEVLGRNPKILKSDLNPPELYKELWETILCGEEWKGELANKRKDGSIYWEVVKICPLRDADNNITGFLKVSQDITDRKQYEESLQYIGTHDPLTGLFNRAYFDAEFKRLESSRDYPVSIVMADIDGLKVVNDSRGHDEGDNLIKGSAEVLLSAFRAGDIVARIGGDEFAILLIRTDNDAVKEAIKRIRGYENDHHLGIFAKLLSLGVSTANRPEELLESMKEADRLMYKEKAERKQQKLCI